MNFWDMLLGGLTVLVKALILPLFGGNLHQAMGLANTLGQGAYATLELAYATLGTFDLTLAAWTLGISALLGVVQLATRIWLFIKSLIPFLN